MSTLKVNTIQNTSAAHSSTPEEIAQGRAKAWCNWNGTGTIAIRDSFNVSSPTDVGSGKHQMNYATAMPNNDYCFVGASAQGNEDNQNPCFCFPLQHDSQYLTTSVRFKTGYHTDNSSNIDIGDRSLTTVAIFGDS